MADLEGTRTIEIAAPLERCFAIAADLDHAAEWHGAMTDVDVLERDSEGRATVVESDIHAAVASLRLKLHFTYDEPHGLRWTGGSGDLRSLEGSWRFEERAEGETVATYVLQIGVSRRLALLAKTVRGPLRERVESLLADHPVEGLKERAERASA